MSILIDLMAALLTAVLLGRALGVSDPTGSADSAPYHTIERDQHEH